jgi:hypothetical protein
MYLQVISVGGFIPVSLFMTVFGLEGNVATVDVGDVEVDIDTGDISVDAPFAQATHSSPVSFTVNPLGANTVAVVGAPFTVSDANCRVVYLLYKPVATGLWSEPFVNGIGGVSLTAAANVITMNGAGAPFLAGDTYWVGLQQRIVSGGGGGAAGGGDAIYTSPQDFTCTVAAPTQLTITGLPYTPTTGQWVSVYYVDVTGMSHTLMPDANAFTWDGIAGTLTVNNATFAVTDSIRAMVFGPDKSYQISSDSKRVQEVAPLSAQSSWESLSDTATLGVATAYFPSTSGMSLVGFKSILSQITLGVNATLTVEGSNDPGGTPTWLDVSRACYDMSNGASGVANWSGTSAMLDLESCAMALIRFKVVVATAPTPCHIDVRRVAI